MYGTRHLKTRSNKSLDSLMSLDRIDFLRWECHRGQLEEPEEHTY